MLKRIIALNLCCEVNIETYSEKVISDVIPCNINLDDIDPNNPFPRKLYQRPVDCIVLNDNLLCNNCKSYQRSKEVVGKPLHINALLSTAKKERLIETIKEQRIVNKELTSKIKYMQYQINLHAVDVGEDLGGFIIKTMDDHKANTVSPFMKLFWGKQREVIGKGTRVRYHPMIIRFCLSLAAKSASAYDELRSSNVLTLPTRRTLRDYKNVVKPGSGFNHQVIDELTKIASGLKCCQRYVVLSFDEMKIKENLVYDKYSGQLVGYVDLGDPETNYASFKDPDSLATHVLVFYIRGLASDLKFDSGYFGTRDVTAHQLLMQFWKVVAVLEDTCNLHVIAAVSDGASSNRAFYRIHQMLDSVHKNVVHRAINLYARDRYIYFFADAPHLMKFW